MGLQRKVAGLLFAPGPPNRNGQCRLRIIIEPARHGFHHPVGKRDLLELLNSIGPIARLNLIELARTPVRPWSSALAFGCYRAPGRIILFEQPWPPWRISGLLHDTILRRFERAGAIVTTLPAVGASLVDWPGDTLRQFIVEDIFLHELGHHVLQHYKGKRPERVARTRDHEAFAISFVEKNRGLARSSVRLLPRGAGTVLL